MRRDIRNESLYFHLPAQRRVPHLVVYKVEVSSILTWIGGRLQSSQCRASVVEVCDVDWHGGI